MERTKQKVKVAVVCLVCVTMCILGAVIPLINPLTTMVGAGALAVMVLRHPAWLSAAALAAGAGISLAVGCSGGYVLSSMLCMIAVGVVIGICMKKEMHFNELMLAAVATSSLVNCGMAVLSVYLTSGAVTMETLMAPYEEIYYAMEQAFVAAGNTAYEAARSVRAIKEFMGSVLIGYMILSSMLIAFGSFMVALGLMWLLYRVVFPQYKVLRSFQVSRVGGVFFFIAFFGMVIFDDQILCGAFSNFVIVFAPIFLLEGLSLLEWNFNRMGVVWFTKLALYICIFSTLFIPFVNMVNAVVALGVLDSIADFRKTQKQKY